MLTGDNLEHQIAESEAEMRSLLSISDPALAEYFSVPGLPVGSVTERTALGVTAIYRAVNIVAGTIAGLPLKTYTRTEDGGKEQTASFLDNPGTPYPITPFAWKETVMFHLLLHAEAFLKYVRNQAGAVIGLLPIHPLAVLDVQWGDDFRRRVVVQLADGSSETLVEGVDLTMILGPNTDGTRGLSPLTIFRQSIKTGMAFELAAYTTATKGASIGGLVVPETDMKEADAKTVATSLNGAMGGPENAGRIAVLNKAMKFHPWSMTNADAQFIEQRAFAIEEVARIYGVPPHLLAQTEKQTSWGTGVAEQNTGLARYTLRGWTDRIEEPLSALLPPPRFAEFDYSGLLQGSPKEEIELLMAQAGGPILTPNEARKIRNLPPIEGGDVLRDALLPLVEETPV